MAGNALENIKITAEDVAQQLIKQLSVLSTDLAVLRAENEKLKQYIINLPKLQDELF